MGYASFVTFKLRHYRPAHRRPGTRCEHDFHPGAGRGAEASQAHGIPAFAGM